jgi:uncharacterized protein YecE (DUF72 family)
MIPLVAFLRQRLVGVMLDTSVKLTSKEGVIDVAPYRIGLPAWAFAGWQNRYFDGRDRLRQYASVFSTVEGNTTFYATPSTSTVRDWLAQVQDLDFKFCFKLPKTVTHQPGGRKPLTEFLTSLKPLESHLGPYLVQLPSVVGPEHASWIRGLLSSLPAEIGYALEVRHPDFFEGNNKFNEYFGDLDCLRTIMDARPIHREAPTHPEVLAARHEKPDLPIYVEPGPAGTMVRLVLHPDDSLNDAYYEEYVAATVGWLDSGGAVYMMIHCPNNLHCPPKARRFQAMLASRTNHLEPLTDWPLPQSRLF